MDNANKVPMATWTPPHEMYCCATPSADVEIQVDKPFYIPGDTIIGLVTLNVKESVQLDLLEMKLSGNEEATLTYNAGSNSQISRKKIIWIEEYCSLQQQSTVYHPGTYTMPFEFQIPFCVPGTFSMVANQGHGTISYKLTVTGTVPSLFAADVEGRLKIYITEPCDRVIKTGIVDSNLVATSLVCFNSGSVGIRATSDKDAYRPGEVATVYVHIDNADSDVTFRHVSVELRQRRLIGFKKMADDATCVLAKNRGPEIPARDIAHAILPLAIPTDTLPSVEGRTLAMRYFIDIVLCAPFSTDVVTSIPVTIYMVRDAFADGDDGDDGYDNDNEPEPPSFIAEKY